MASGCKKASKVSSTRAGEFLSIPCFPKEQILMQHDSMISYPNYKFIFPIKALGMFAKKFGDLELQ
jgi:hypothetical protein